MPTKERKRTVAVAVKDMSVTIATPTRQQTSLLEHMNRLLVVLVVQIHVPVVLLFVRVILLKQWLVLVN